jgi:hypothetical protein
MARSKAIDVTQCTGEVARHIEAITKKLSKKDHENAIKLVERIKTERVEWVGNQTLTVLKKFHKYTALDELSDQCVQEMPDVHRDFFRHKLFYVLNGIQQLVDKQIPKLKSGVAKASAASNVSTTAPTPTTKAQAAKTPVAKAPAASAVSTTAPTPTTTESVSEQAPSTKQSAESTPTEADTPTEVEVETDESDQWIDPDATIIEITQHHEESSDGATPPPTLTDASTQTQTQTQTRPVEDQQYCVGWCEFEGEQGNKPMTRCSICMRWHHVACVDGQDEEEYEGSWTCPVCRDMPNRVVAMQTKLDQVMALLTKLTTPLTTTTTATATSTAPPTELQSQPPQSQNKLLCGNRFQPLAQSPTSATSSHPATDDSLSEDSDTAILPPNQEMWKKKAQKHKKQPSKTARTQQRKRAFKATVLSDSVLAKVDVNRTEDLSSEANCELIFVHDAGDIDATIRCVQKDTLSRSDPLVIHTGTNNIRGEGVHGIVRRLETLESTLQDECYQRVALSSIVYRRSGRRVREKISMLNDAIHSICARNEWTYIDNDNLDESCIEHGDTVHPNRYGTERLAHNLANGLKELVLHGSY